MSNVSDTHIKGVIALLESQKEINAIRMRAIASASPSEYDQLDNINSMYDHLIDTAELYLEES